MSDDNKTNAICHASEQSKYMRAFPFKKQINKLVYICISTVPQNHCGDNREGTLFS